MENIVNATGQYLLFTAAPPGQQGTGHINMKAKEYWIDKFSELDYLPMVTKGIRENWARIGAPKYICDNLIVCMA